MIMINLSFAEHPINDNINDIISIIIINDITWIIIIKNIN